MVNLAKATNDELDDIKFALEETKATLEEQNTLKMRLEEATQEIHKLKNSTDEGMIIEEIRKQLKDAKVSLYIFVGFFIASIRDRVSAKLKIG